MKTRRRNGTGKEAGKHKRALAFCVIISLFIGHSLSLSAQCAAENKAFKTGEALTYDLYFNWKFIWVKAGEAKMYINETIYNSTPAYRTDLLAISNKRADMFFKMRDTISGIVSRRLEPLYFRKGAEEGKSYTVDEGWFTRRDSLSFVNQKRVKKDGTVLITEFSDTRCIHDMLSILAQARSYDPSDYTIGQRIAFPIATGRRLDEQTLIYRGKEEFEANNGTVYRCLIFSLVEIDSNNKEKEVITFYITDDDNHLPVRLDMFLNFGSAKAFLKTVKGNRHPLTSIIKTKK